MWIIIVIIIVLLMGLANAEGSGGRSFGSALFGTILLIVLLTLLFASC